jgi:arginyl-tRNA synthetase
MEQLTHDVSTFIKDRYDIDVAVVFTRPDSAFGDLATNVAMQLAGRVGRSPRDIAEELTAALRELDSVREASVAGPGFINLRLTDAALVALVKRPLARALTGQTYVLEYSCPNAFKELHTGHLYQTIYGDIVARLLERAGATLHRTSFGGDVGLHVAKCIYGMQQVLAAGNPSTLDEVDSSPFVRANWISQCYVEGAKAYEADAEAKPVIEQLNKAVYQLHETNDHLSELAQLYWTTRQWSYDYFNAFYAMINVDTMRYYPESETTPVGLKVVHEQLTAGNLIESQGAVVFVGDEDKHLHTRVFITSQGLPTYETKDIGVMWKELEDYQFDRRVLITGNDQKEYMRVVFAAADTFRPGIGASMTHLTNGTVRFGDGTKMSSRLGNVSRAVDVIEVVREKVRTIVQDEAIVDDVTLGAIKYLFAKYRIGGDISFNIDETVTLQGNSGPYLQYAHARACSILAKADTLTRASVEFDDSERALLLKLGEYTEVVERAAAELMPHGICSYLYELAQEFNRFYEKSHVIGDEREAVRLGLVARYRDTLADGLSILGIAAPERM